MKKLLLLSILSILSIAQAAVVEIGVVFTNRTATGDAWTRNGVTAIGTNTPLNNQNWFTTNNPARSATNLWNHLGANMNGIWKVSMTSPTNVVIRGNDAQFSITGTYALLTTNTSGTGGTNQHPFTVGTDWTDPQKHQPYQTNRTNDASATMQTMKLYALQEARLNFFSNELYLATRRSGGSDTNVFVTNAPSIHATNVTAGKLTATSGTLDGLDVTNIPVASATSARITDLQVFSSATITNLAVPGSGLNSSQIGSGANASGAGAVAYGNNSTSSGIGSVALGTSAEATGNFSFASGSGNQAQGQGSVALGNNSVAGYDFSLVFGDSVSADRASQAKLGVDLTVTGEIEGQGTTRFANVVRSRFSGPIRFDEGAYSGVTGFSNNIIQLSTNPVTRLSGATGNYNINSLRTGDGIEMADRVVEILNDSAYTATLIDTSLDGFETLNTNEMRCGGVNLTIAPGASAKLKYGTSYSRWELLYPSPLAQFTISGTTNQVSFGGTNSVPANTSVIRKWISVQVSDETNAYRLPLYE